MFHLCMIPIKSGGVQSVSFTSQTTGLTSWFPESLGCSKNNLVLVLRYWIPMDSPYHH